MKKRYLFSFVALFVLLMGSSCSTLLNQEEKSEQYKKEIEKEDQEMADMEEANLDDDLNAVERKDVHKIFEDEVKERERTDNAMF